MLPINRLPIKTRSGDVFPHVRSRWVRAGGTSWAHQAPSITLWQEPLEHGGASVEPQVKCVGWAVFLMHSKGMYGCHICIQALYVSYTNWHVDTHYTCTCCMCARTSHLPHAPPVSWGQALLNPPPAQHLSTQSEKTFTLQTCSIHAHTPYACALVRLCTSVNRKQEVRKKWCLWFWQSLRASWVSS